MHVRVLRVILTVVSVCRKFVGRHETLESPVIIGAEPLGGSYFFHEFLRVLHFRNYVAGQIHYPRRNRDYSVSQMLLALVHPILLGLDRIETAGLLHSDETFQYLTRCRVSPIHRLYGAFY